MTPLTLFRIPNDDNSTYADQQQELHELDVQALANGFAWNGVFSGCAVTATGTPDRNAQVAAGSVMVGGVKANVSSGAVDCGAADGTNPRYDLICVDNAGAKSVVNGTAAADPDKPDYPSSKIVLAEVWRPAADDTIESDKIVEKRIFLPAGLCWTVLKASDETVTSSTTVQNDDELKVALGANEIMLIETFLFVNAANATMDVRYGWSVPASATMLWGSSGVPNNNFASFGITVGTNTPLALKTESQTLTGLGTFAGTMGHALTAKVKGGGTAGTVNLQWAQDVSDAGALKVLADSIIRCTLLKA